MKLDTSSPVCVQFHKFEILLWHKTYRCSKTNINQSCHWGKTHQPRFSPAQYSLTVQNCGIKHHSTLPLLSIFLNFSHHPTVSRPISSYPHTLIPPSPNDPLILSHHLGGQLAISLVNHPHTPPLTMVYPWGHWNLTSRDSTISSQHPIIDPNCYVHTES